MPRDPFAIAETVTYNYVESEYWAKGPDDVSGRPTQGLREAYGLSREDVDGVWIRLRIPLSQGDRLELAALEQGMILQTEEGVGVKQSSVRSHPQVFELLAEAWSFGSDKPDAAAYRRLASWAADWINLCLRDARNRADVVIQKKETSSSRRKSSPASSAPADASANVT